MRQHDNFEEFSHLETQTKPRQPARKKLWRGGLVETLAAFRYRDEAAYEEWLDERDTVIIAATLSRLSDRHLSCIGLSRDTLVMDIDDLKRITERNRRIAHEVLEIVADTEPEARNPAAPMRPMAAE